MMENISIEMGFVLFSLGLCIGLVLPQIARKIENWRLSKKYGAEVLEEEILPSQPNFDKPKLLTLSVTDEEVIATEDCWMLAADINGPNDIEIYAGLLARGLRRGNDWKYEPKG